MIGKDQMRLYYEMQMRLRAQRLSYFTEAFGSNVEGGSAKCKQCGDSEICEHKQQGNRCKDCQRGSICEHHQQRSSCEVPAAQHPRHQRVRSASKTCGSSSIRENQLETSRVAESARVQLQDL